MRHLPEAMLMLAFAAGLGVDPQTLGASAPLRAGWQEKVDPWVLATAAAGETEFLVYLAEQADVSGARALETKEEKGGFVAAQLQAVANATQGPLLALLARRGAEHRAFWVANMIWVRGGLDLVQELAERDDVAHVYANPRVALQRPPSEMAAEGEAPEAIEWGVQMINAPQVWADGFTGQGVVIGGQDTGYDWDHPALRNKYRGWNGTAADHNYNWHDAIHSGGGVCGPNASAPCDDQSHGTHTMGTMVGDDGGTNQIGVAPGARWMGCRNMDQGNGTPATYSECFQWFIAPTDLNNQNPDPTRAPHVINNSWGCPPSEGCNPGSLQTVVENTRAAGIVVVVSAGNSGSGCSTVNDPPAIYDASFSVGATTSTDVIAGYSSRGPVTIDGSGRLKPNISAPGSSVRSSVPGTGYGTFSGTSMAGPHVAGAVALLLAAHPTLRGNVDAVETLLERTALPKTTTQNCGTVPGTADPNNTYGYGRLDALSAVRPADVGVTLTASPDPVTVGQPLTFTASVSNAGPGAASRATLVDDLPGSLTFVSATPSQGACAFASGAVTCVLGAIASGGSATVQIVTTPTAAGTVTNAVDVGAGQIDPVAANNAASAVVTVSQCGLAAPVVTAPLSTPPGTTGLQASVPPAAGHTFAWTLTGGTITGGQGTNQITFTAGAAGTTMILGVVEDAGGCLSPPGRRNVQVHFLDVPPSHQFHTFVNTLARNQVTGGCGGGNYCPSSSVTREQMAVFLLASREGPAYAPPACTSPVFSDVPCNSPFAAWVNELAARGVTSGCGGGNYCPAAAVTREQMAPFLLLTKEGSGYTPPACTSPVFADVPCSSPFARWVNELSVRGITGGCGGGNYCPAAPNTRGEMAVFLVRNFGLN